MNSPTGPAPLSKSIYFAAAALILLGSAIRLRAFFAVDSLSHDEVCVVFNLMHRNFAGLLKPLDFEQAAPLGFLWLEKSVGSILGYGELAMRLFPLLAGLALLPMLFLLLREILNPPAALIGLLLAATEPWLIKWSVDVKPYSSDAFLSALILYLFWIGYRNRWPLRNLLLTAAVGSLALFFSYASALILSGAGLAVFSLELHRRNWIPARRLAAVGSLWAITLAAIITIIDAPVIATPYLQNYWASQFMPLPPHSLHDLHWFLYAAQQTFRSTMQFGWPRLALLALLLGIITLYTQNRPALLLLISPLPIALLAAGLHKYPFGDRLLTYATPIVITLLAAAITKFLFPLLPSSELRLSEAKSRPVGSLLLPRLAALTLLLCLTTQNLYTSTIDLFHPPMDEEMKPILHQLATNLRPGDEIVLSRYASRAYAYYAKTFGLSAAPALNLDAQDPKTTQQEMSPLQGHPRIWIILMHEDPHAPHVIQALPLLAAQKLGQQRQRQSIGTATLYLYDFSPHA